MASGSTARSTWAAGTRPTVRRLRSSRALALTISWGSPTSAGSGSLRHLVLWLPLRREGIQPAPGVGFSSNIPSLAGTTRELRRADDLRVLLTPLRHLKSIEI